MKIDTAASRRSPPPATSGGARLVLLDGFELRDGGRPVPLPLTAQRTLVFVALADRPVRRAHVASSLWADATEEHATASLRSAVWRLRRSGRALVDATSSHLRLAVGVTVDYREAVSTARRLLANSAATETPDLGRSGLTGELLPEWLDDWLLLERERFRQLRLHALEVLCEQLIRIGRFADAVEAGLAAVACEPLRESAQRRLIQAHLAERNPSEAIRQYRLYRDLLARELGLDPSPELTELVRTEGRLRRG